MKKNVKIVCFVLALIFIYDYGYTDCSPYPTVTCAFYFCESREEAETAPDSCHTAGGQIWPYYLSCPTLIDDGYASVGFAPYGGCLKYTGADGFDGIFEYQCYYYPIEPPEDCCKEEESEGICCLGQQCPKSNVGNPINVLSGNNKEKETDLSFNTIFDKGFKIYRNYRSRSERDSPMGFGWTHSYNVILAPLSEPEVHVYQIQDEANRTHHFQDSDGNGTYTGILSTKGYLVAETDDTFTWHRGNGITYRFNQFLQFIAKEDGNGNVQTLTYDTNSRLETVTDQATSRSIGFTYNTDGKITSITGPVTNAVPDGVWVSYEYDAQGNLTRVVYADVNNGSSASGFEYLYQDPNDPHNLTEKRNLAGEFLSSWQYDSQDRAFKNTTRDGKGVTISGYGSANIVVTDAQGVQKTYTIATINGRRRITHISSGGCASCGDDATRYGYDDQNRVIEKEYANGRIDQYTNFDARDRYQTETQAVGTSAERTLHYTYHPATGDKLSITETSILGTGHKETLFDYDSDGNATPNENPTRLLHRQIERGFTQEASGTVIPYEHITTYTYTPKGQVLSIDGPQPGDQDTITYTYDPVTGDRLSASHPLTSTTHFQYDTAGNLTHITDINGQITTITYDGRNRQLASTTNTSTSSRTYTAAGELATSTDALNRILDYTYNPQGFLQQITFPSGDYLHYTYNDLGQRIEETIFSANNTRTHFRGTDYGDPATNPDLAPGKPFKTLHYNHDQTSLLATTYTYDPSGNLASVLDANNHTITYTYDLFNRLQHVEQPGATITTYTYDLHGNLASVTDAQGRTTTYTYDDLGRLITTHSPDTGTTLYSYDPAGNLRHKTQNNQTIEYQYDILNRLTHILYSDPAQNITMTYDSGSGTNLMGRLASVTDSSGTTTYSYDPQGNLTTETKTIQAQTYTTTYTYDLAGNLRSITYPTGHTIDYLPSTTDPAQITAVQLGTQALASDLTYQPLGPLATMTLSNGIQLSKTYDLNYQIATITAGTVMQRTYSPDNIGNIEVITNHLDPSRSQSFDYDPLGRLTNANGIYGTINYTYDKTGNRLTRTHNTKQNRYAYTPGTNRLQTITGTHPELFQYDADGNTTTRIPGFTNPNPAPTAPSDYTYNSAGQRINKTTAATTIYHYDLSGQLIAETDPSGNLIKAYIWLLGQPLAMISADNSISYFHNDHLGTPQKMTNSTGVIVWAADYLPFGEADVTVETVENNLRFAGQIFDKETGLHYNWHRFYDPKIGRYLRADPIGLRGGINPYIYSSNNSINNIDPKGLNTTFPLYHTKKPNLLGEHGGGGAIIGGMGLGAGLTALWDMITGEEDDGGNNWTETTGQQEKLPPYQPGIHEKCMMECKMKHPCSKLKRIRCYIFCIGGALSDIFHNPFPKG